MRKLSVFNSVTLDGYFAGPNGDLSWAHDGSEDAEFNSFVADNAKGGGVLLFGYALYIRDPVFILGQGFGVFVYARNLYFELRDRGRGTAVA